MSDLGIEDAVLDSLDALVDVLRENQRRNNQAIARAELTRARRLEGASYRDIVESAQGPLIVELATESLAALMLAAGRLRRAEADALHAEGMTMERIAELYGVTRQRVSALLRSRSSAA